MGSVIAASRYREVLAHFATGVAVVTATDTQPVGMAVNSFASVSLEPPLVSFCASTASETWPQIRAAGIFAVNVLDVTQQETCRRFASKGADRFRDCRWRIGASGAPILEDALAWINCDIEREHMAGDHVIVLGRVRDLDAREGEPLLFFQSRYGRFLPLPNDREGNH